MKRYTVDKKLLTERPEIEIGNKIYAVDDRRSNFMELNSVIKGIEDETAAMDIIIKYGLGESALKEINENDYPLSVMQQILTLITAAMQGITVEEADKRFQSATQSK